MGGVSDNSGIRIKRLAESLGQAFYFWVFQYVGIIFLKFFCKRRLYFDPHRKFIGRQKENPVPEERQAQMKNDKAFGSMYTEDSLPERYDSWIKKVLDRLIFNEVRSLARRKRKIGRAHV